MRKFVKDNKKLLLVILVVVVGLPIIILTPSPIGVIPRDMGIAIVGYCGSIIGGFLTLYGVWWTIDDNQKARSKELELQYCPVLNVDFVRRDKDHRNHLGTEIIMCFNHEWFNDADLFFTEQLIELSNVGRGEIQQTKICIEKCETVFARPGEINSIDTKGSYIMIDGALNFIPVNGKVHLHIGLPKLNKAVITQITEGHCIRLAIELGVGIDGVFSSKPEKYKIMFCLDYIVEDGEVNVSLDSIRMEYIKEELA